MRGTDQPFAIRHRHQFALERDQLAPRLQPAAIGLGRRQPVVARLQRHCHLIGVSQIEAIDAMGRGESNAILLGRKGEPVVEGVGKEDRQLLIAVIQPDQRQGEILGGVDPLILLRQRLAPRGMLNRDAKTLVDRQHQRLCPCRHPRPYQLASRCTVQGEDQTVALETGRGSHLAIGTGQPAGTLPLLLQGSDRLARAGGRDGKVLTRWQHSLGRQGGGIQLDAPLIVGQS